MFIPVLIPIYLKSFSFFDTTATISDVAFILLYSCLNLEETFLELELELELNRIKLKHISYSNESV